MKIPLDKSSASNNTGGSGLFPKILTFVVAALAILYFYPHPDENELYRYRVGDQWTHPDLVSQIDFSVQPDSSRLTSIEDSVKSNVKIYYQRQRVDIAKLSHRLFAYVDSVFETLGSDSFPNLKDARMLVYNVVQTGVPRYYKSVVLPRGANKKRAVVLKDDEILDVDIYTPEDIQEVLASDLATAGLQDYLGDLDISSRLEPNVVYDSYTSAEAFKTAYAAAVQANTRVYKIGQRIIKEGQSVTEADAVAIDEYTAELITNGIGDTRSGLLTWLGQALYILLLMGALVVYVVLYEPAVMASARSFGFIIGLVALFVVVGAMLSTILTLGLYVMPVAIVPILVLVFFNSRLALWTGLVTAMLFAGMSIHGFEYITLQFCAVSAAVFSLRDLTKRSQLLLTSALVGVCYVAGYFAFEWLMRGSFEGIRWRMVGVLAVNAAFTSMAYVFMFAIERMFGFISNVTLVELTDVNSPLLRKLCDECPGTFNHVVAVSNLASDAARQIGANDLLVRAGAMYHDIGKLANPMFFTENQHGVNPHDGLSPLKSAEIIISHVTEGLHRAEKAGLPSVIRDFIAEHHGAGKAKYFYFTYCKQHPDEEVDPAPFTYPGPNPRTRETSVLMMADAVEAASRSLKEHTPKAITDLVNNIIDGQIADGLHNDSPLSFHDIKTIKEVFIRRLMTMYHSRIAYPDDPTKKKTE